MQGAQAMEASGSLGGRGSLQELERLRTENMYVCTYVYVPISAEYK